MSHLPLKTNLTFSDFIMQVFSTIKPKLIEILKQSLENELIEQRDKIIGNKPYQRSSGIKRWGYTIRKYIVTPLGILTNVRIPRMREKGKEVSLFIDKYVHYTTDFINDVILAHTLNMSTRKITVWFRSRLKEVVSYATFSRFIKVVEEEIDKIRNSPLPPDIEGLILDGIWGHIRIKKKKGVILVALGVDREGKIHLLDWELAEKESFNSYGVLLSRLKKRGLEKVKIIVGDGARGLPEAGKFVYPGSNFQYCLWHLSQTLMKQVSHLPPKIKDRFYNQFWEIFNAYDLDECYDRYFDFLKKWGKIRPSISKTFALHEENLFHYYDFPFEYRHRLRTVNMAEGFFRHLREFLRRYPGWIDAKQVDKIMLLFLKGMKAYREVFAKPTQKVELNRGTFIYAF